MIIFLLGVILGILISVLVFLGYVYFQLKNQNRIHKVIEKVEQIARPKAKIFMPPDEQEQARQEIIEKNDARGKATSADELGL